MPENLPRHIIEGVPAEPESRLPVSAGNLDDLKRTRLVRALEASGGNQSEAARQLGISRTSVWNQMKRYGIQVHQSKTRAN